MEYWERRQLADDAKHAYMQAEEVIKAIERLYAAAGRRIRAQQERIRTRFMRQYKLDPEKAKELLLSPVGREEYLKLLEEIKRLGPKNPMREELLAKAAAPAYAYRISLQEAMELENEAITAHIAEQERQLIEKHLKETAKDQSMRAGFRIQKKAGVAFRFAGVSEELANIMIRRPWSGLTFSARVWKSQDALTEAMNTTLLEGIYTGMSGERIAQEIAEELKVPIHRARTLVRTETTYVCNQADMAAYEEAQIERYRYDAVLDLKTSRICRKLDGKVFKVKEGKVGVNYPPMHPNCRSGTVTVFDGEELARMERWARDPVTGKGVKVPANMTYEDWLKLQKETYGEERIALAKKMSDNRNSDKKQLEAYRKALGTKHMPKDIATFQMMKYTEPKEWAKTKRARATISEVDGKENWTAAFRKKAKEAYWTMRGNDVEMSSHALGRYLERRDKMPGGCTTDQLAQICAKPANYAQADGRLVHYYDGAAVVFSEETGEMVSFIDRKNPKKDWRSLG